MSQAIQTLPSNCYVLCTSHLEKPHFTCELLSLQLEPPYLDEEMVLAPPFGAVEKTVSIVDGLVWPGFCTEVDFAILVAELCPGFR